MSARYLVTCRCGATVAVTAGQAGQEVPCQCGLSVTIPLLRELRALPQAAESAKAGPVRPQSAAPGGTVRGRIIYAGFLATVLASLLGGLLLYARSQIAVEWSQELQSQADSEVIDRMNADEIFQAWHAMHTQGLGEKAPTGFMINRNNRSALGQIASWSLAFAAVAAASTIGYSVATRRAAGS